MHINKDLFVVSDTHFGHKNIIRYCNRPENHDELMVRNWNSVVSDEDEVLHLGDLFFHSSGVEFIRQLKGKKYLILGNHDHKSKSWYEDVGFTVVPRRIFKTFGFTRVMFTHYPEDTFIGWDINIHGHIHNNSYVEKMAGERKYINVSIEVMNYMPVRLGKILDNIGVLDEYSKSN